MTHDSSPPHDLRTLARQVMLEAGFAPDVPPAAVAEAAALDPARIAAAAQRRDLRGLLWSSIDNADSRDLDQVEFAEKLPSGEIRLLIGIADVDAWVPAGAVACVMRFPPCRQRETRNVTRKRRFPNLYTA